jgi:hypothetical protein
MDVRLPSRPLSSEERREEVSRWSLESVEASRHTTADG